MNIAQIRYYDIANGPGIRSSLFVSGCTHNCKNCFNKMYQNFSYGRKLDADIAKEIYLSVENERVTGFNILGGEPLQQTNDSDLYNLVKEVSSLNKPIWLWTGYTFEELLGLDNFSKIKQILQYVDVLIDGRFVEEQKDLSLFYRGSSNQRVLNCKKSLEFNKAVSIDI